MNRTTRMVSGVVLAATLVIGESESTMASEPGNNTFTPNSSQLSGDWEVLAGTNGSFIAGTMTGSLPNHTDVDYILVSCASRFKPNMDDIRLGGSPLGGALPGDFDIFVMDPDSSTAIASGQLGGTSPEVVNLQGFGRHSVVVKIIHFAGGFGNYQLRVDCS
jgi:hypothetical protein